MLTLENCLHPKNKQFNYKIKDMVIKFEVREFPIWKHAFVFPGDSIF